MRIRISSWFRAHGSAIPSAKRPETSVPEANRPWFIRASTSNRPRTGSSPSVPAAGTLLPSAWPPLAGCSRPVLPLEWSSRHAGSRKLVPVVVAIHIALLAWFDSWNDALWGGRGAVPVLARYALGVHARGGVLVIRRRSWTTRKAFTVDGPWLAVGRVRGAGVSSGPSVVRGGRWRSRLLPQVTPLMHNRLVDSTPES